MTNSISQPSTIATEGRVGVFVLGSLLAGVQMDFFKQVHLNSLEHWASSPGGVSSPFWDEHFEDQPCSGLPSIVNGYPSTGSAGLTLCD
jgi:hypothetical protein